MEKCYYYLSEPQKSIWLTEQLISQNALNNISGNILIKEKVNFPFLKKALNYYVKKNDAIRLRIILENGNPKQYVHTYEPFSIEVQKVNNELELEALNTKIVETPFSIIDSDLFYFILFEFPDGTGGLHVKFHHLIADAWTMSLFINECMDIYGKLLNNESIDLSLNTSYIDFLSAEENYKNSQRYKKDEKFWKEEFNFSPELVSVVPNKQNTLSTEAKRKTFQLDLLRYRSIMNLCKIHHCSIYTFLMAVYSIYLGKLNQVKIPILGTPVLNRTNAKEKQTSGMYISTVPFPVELEKDMSFSNFLNSVMNTQLSIFRHQKYPYSQIAEHTKKIYGFSENLYDVALSYQNARDDSFSSRISYTTKWLFSGQILNSLSIHFYDMDNTGILDIYYDYQISQLTDEDINLLHTRILTIIDQVLENPNALLKNIEIVSLKEKSKFMSHENVCICGDPKAQSILETFKEQVKKYPEKSAIIFEENSITYSELDKKSNQLAHFILKNYNCTNKIIGIMLPRSIDIMISVLGVLKSGNGYLLIDPTLPQDRIIYMLKNSMCPLLLVDKTDIPINFSHVVNLNTFPFDKYEISSLDDINNIYDPFCIIYTSGSTGNPKGVELNRLGIANLVLNYQEHLQILDCENFISISTVSFDMFIVENFVPLLSGKTVILANEEQQKIPILMSELIIQKNVDFILSTPSKMELLLDNSSNNCLSKLKVIQLGGEVFSSSLYKNLRPLTNARIYNGYGPSECTACCSNKKIESGDCINIGVPFSNTNIFICNDDMNLLPVGFPGEICVSGYGIANGYNHNEELTKKSFIPNPFGEGFLYRTGDIARYNRLGELEYIGRRDSQIKLHGLRIELEEITNHIKKIPKVKQAITTIQKVNGFDCICAYIACHNKISEKELKDSLKNVLPQYMIPSYFVFLEELPLNLNGKIDKKALPLIKIEQKHYEPPTTPTQIKLSLLWEKILNIEKIGINDNFFDLGGDSLCLIKLISEIYTKFQIHITMKDFFNFPTIYDLSHFLDSSHKKMENKKVIYKAKKQSSYPLSSAQKRIYYTVALDGKNTTTYNTPGGIVFNKIPSLSKLENSLAKLIQRHVSLRTYFDIDGSQLVQKVEDYIPFNLEIEYAKKEMQNELFYKFIKPFNLNKAPLFHTKLIIFEDNTCVLFLDFHHIICDGVSIRILLDELSKLYKGDTLEPINIDYIDFSVWEQEQINKKMYSVSQQYWLKRMSGELPILNMPTVYSRPRSKSIEGKKIYQTINNDLTRKIYNLAKKSNTTPFLLLLSIYYILLFKYTEQQDIIVGSPIIGRENSETNNIVGMFVNTLALRQSISPTDKFSEFIDKVTNNCLSDFEHKQFPFDELIKILDIKKDSSRNSLFDTMFIYQNEGDPPLHFQGLDSSYYDPDSHISKFDFSLEVKPVKDTLQLTFEYCTKLFDKNFMERFSKHYLQLIYEILENKDETIANLSIITPEERDQILYKFNRTEQNSFSKISLLEHFKACANNFPEKTAIICNKSHFSYKEIDEKSNQIANMLEEKHLPENSVIAILAQRSELIPIAMIGILKSGNAYLVIDPELPNDRIEYMLTIANAPILLSEKDIVFSSVTTIKIKDFEKASKEGVNLKNNTLLSVVFTSGSTGFPKGVSLKRESMVHLIYCYERFIHTQNYNTFLSTCSIAFDMFAVEVFLPLLTGKTLIMATDKEYKDPSYISNLISTYCVDFMLITPSKLELLLINPKTSRCLSILKNIQLGGESLTKAFYENLRTYTNAIIGNEYGPTETTACATYNEISSSENLTIGKPFPNIAVYICNKDGNLCPIGIPGEICIAGSGISFGYINNVEANKKSFVPNPFGKGNLYKTGDIAKYLENGDIYYIGRQDFQIKIHGLRVELNEIEKQMLEIPAIKNSVVLYHDSNHEQYITAFYTASKKISHDYIRSTLAKKLPFYMIPRFFTKLESMPMTLTGKIDKKKLINYTPVPEERTNSYIEPKTEKQKLICNILEDILGTKVGLRDNIFDLGLDSLLALKFKIKLLSHDIELDYATIFTTPIVEDLCSITSDTESSKNSDYYDYGSINNILKRNSITKSDKISFQSCNNVLLFGANGFVGSHILYQFLKQDQGKIYCVIRDKSGISATDRLLKVLHFYFGNELDPYIGNRLFIIHGDITCDKFNLSLKDYKLICENTSIVINSVANVKHFGNYNKFYKINVETTQKIVDFCLEHNKKLLHISSLSVSGNSLASNVHAESTNKILFSERNLFINQSLENVYIRSKFEAEKIVLSHIASYSLNAKVLRLGNITNRYTDGKFQINPESNAFLVRLKALFQLGIIPDYLVKHYLEFTPVDYCSRAIINIMQHYVIQHNIYHLYNNNHLPISDFLKYVNNNGISLKVVEQDYFSNTIKNVLLDSNRESILSGIINDLTPDRKLLYDSNIKIDSEFSLDFLESIGFHWPIIDYKYITKYLNYLKFINFI